MGLVGQILGNQIQDALMGGLGGDEDAVAAAVEEMYSMCGNAGQESIIMEGEGDFTDWAYQFLEEPEVEGIDMASVLGEEKYDATHEIWHRGISAVYEQSGFHDNEDEQGEGTGDEHSGVWDAIVDFFT